MQSKPTLWEQPYGRGLTLLMSLFAFLGLMSGWMLLEIDFSDGWKSSTWWNLALVMQAALALNSALCLTMAWLLWTRNRSALLLGVLYVLLGIITQAGMYSYTRRLGSRVDGWSLGVWLAEALFFGGIVAYLYWLRRRGVLR